MTHDDKETWRINIEDDADQVCSIYGEAAVDGVFQRYDATCFDDLCPSYYEEVFGDLELMINDNRESPMKHIEKGLQNSPQSSIC